MPRATHNQKKQHHIFDMVKKYIDDMLPLGDEYHHKTPQKLNRCGDEICYADFSSVFSG